jgi:HEAT repeat protein
LWALIEKATISDNQTKEKIILKASEIIEDPNQTSFRRWQCCYVISGIGDEQGIPSLIYTLTKDKDIIVRGCAACALGKFKNKQAIDALKQAKTTEQNQEVLNWINKALDGQFLKN